MMCSKKWKLQIIPWCLCAELTLSYFANLKLDAVAKKRGLGAEEIFGSSGLGALGTRRERYILE